MQFCNDIFPRNVSDDAVIFYLSTETRKSMATRDSQTEQHIKYVYEIRYSSDKTIKVLKSP